MKLKSLEVTNFRSFKNSGEIKICPLQGLVGENNTGKSNILLAIEALCSAGSGGVTVESFNNPELPVIIKGVFCDLNPTERKVWRPYLVNNELILEKQLYIDNNTRTDKTTVKTEFHGYKAEPRDWFLSIEKIIQREGDKPKWAKIVQENALPDYFLVDGKCNKTIYTKSLEKYLSENEVEYDEPDISETQALGLQSNVIASLPTVYMLRAISDYSNEIDKRTSSTTFRKLVADLSDRIIQADPRYTEIQTALDTIKSLLNKTDTEVQRLDSLDKVEHAIATIIQKLMPSVEGIKLTIETDEVKEIFSRGISITINDGVLTDVLSKGHGLQRCVIFSLLQALILNQRDLLVSKDGKQKEIKAILLLIEEPELYIHPQLQKLFFDVMKEFSNTDQVIYTTHSPLMVDAYEYQSISIVRKDNIVVGSKVSNCNTNAFDGLTDKKVFQGLTQLNPNVNELFFSKKVVLVEGPEDKIAITETAKCLELIKTRSEEIDITIIVAGGKQSIPFFQRVLNAFNIPYVVLHDLDIVEGMNQDNKAKQEKDNDTIAKLANNNKVVVFPIKLEETLGLKHGHLKDQFEAYKYFTETANINDELKRIIKETITF